PPAVRARRALAPRRAPGARARGGTPRRSRSRRNRSFRTLRSCLLRGHVGGVPVGPVLVVLATMTFLVLAVRGGRTTQRLSEISRRAVRRGRRFDSTGQPRRDLLQEPAVA